MGWGGESWRDGGAGTALKEEGREAFSKDAVGMLQGLCCAEATSSSSSSSSWLQLLPQLARALHP
jgi:hypothetical protein